MKQIFIFAGTTEGREIAQWISSKGIKCTVSVATEYGKLLMPNDALITVLQGRLTHEQMKKIFLEKEYFCVIDATHPFAQLVSKEIQIACAELNLKYYRLIRSTNQNEIEKKYLTFDSVTDAAVFLNTQKGNIFVTTGSKDLHLLTSYIEDISRLYVRVLPSIESIKLCNDANIFANHIIAMQGPFSKQENEIQLSKTNASFLLTKESGSVGGFEEKLSAAESLHISSIVIKNPEVQNLVLNKNRFSSNDLLQELSNVTGINLMIPEKKNLTLAGVGPGNDLCLTEDTKKAISCADVIFGSNRVLNAKYLIEKNIIPYYTPEKVFDYLEAHPFIRNPVVLFSGDAGFYSGSNLFLSCKKMNWNIKVLSGISSLSYFSSKIGKPYQSWKLLSLHGRNCNIISNIRNNEHCFFLLSDCNQVQEIGKKIFAAQKNGVLGFINVTLGFQLSYSEEKIIYGDFNILLSAKDKGLYVLLFEHKDFCKQNITCGLNDNDFVRNKTIPMTKQSVRVLAISKLKLTKNSIVYDIGSGTGSVTIETARIDESIKVFSFECDKTAFELTQSNIQKFSQENVYQVFALAPDGFENLPPPTHLFIGGSNGNLCKIIYAAIKKNPLVRIVVTAITLETLNACLSLFKKLDFEDLDVSQVSVQTLSPLGEKYNFFKPQNQVYIISCNSKKSSMEKIK